MPFVSAELSPLISRCRDKLLAVFFPPEGKPFYKSPFVLHSKAMSGSISTRPHPSPSAPPSPSKGKASVGSASYIESASNFNPSINILQKNKFTLKEVSQNEKVTHHSLPLRGGRCRRRRRMRADRKSKPQHKMIFALFAQRKEGFPLGGAVAQATDEGG